MANKRSRLWLFVLANAARDKIERIYRIRKELEADALAEVIRQSGASPKLIAPIGGLSKSILKVRPKGDTIELYEEKPPPPTPRPPTGVELDLKAAREALTVLWPKLIDGSANQQEQAQVLRLLARITLGAEPLPPPPGP